jgi:hypothetical protein
MPNRLTKASLRARCEAEIEHLYRVHQFDPAKGIGQLDGRSRDAIIGWGKIEAFRIILENLCGK